MKKTLFAYFMFAICPFLIGDAAGHGLGGDVAPPISFSGQNVTVSTSITPWDLTIGEIDEANMAIRFFNLDTNQTLEKVTYRMEVWHSNKLLARNFYYDVDGNLDIIVRPIYDCNDPKPSECTIYYGAEHPSAPGTLYARIGEKLVIKGPLFDKGGLYNIRVDIEGATSPKTLLSETLSYETFVSVAQKQIFNVQTATAELDVVVKTYYDRIENLKYDGNNDAISFSMPFDWSPDYIEQVAIVHEEIQIPKTFSPYNGERQFKGYVDGVELNYGVLIFDPYTYEDVNVIHFLVIGDELKRINDILGSEHKEQDVMNFRLVPGSTVSKNMLSSYLVDVNTMEKNGVTMDVSWDSSYSSGEDIPFEITFFGFQDEVLPNIRYAYTLSEHESDTVISQNSEILAFEGIDTQVLNIPDEKTYRLDVLVYGQGTIGLDFDPKYAGIGSTIIEVGAGVENKQVKVAIPKWVKSNAGWWATGEIDDKTFVTAIKYLINNEIIIIPATLQGEPSSSEIPEWVKSNAGWWATGEIDDKTFVVALQYLIENGILKVGQ